MRNRFIDSGPRVGILLMILVGLFSSGGCMTIVTVNEKMDAEDSEHLPIVMSGSRADLDLIGYSGDATGFGLGACVPIFGIIDLPFSLVLDILLLPVTIPWAIGDDDAEEEVSNLMAGMGLACSSMVHQIE